mgnify:CR=1 FL=1
MQVDATLLAQRLSEAEAENSELREKVKELTLANDDAAAELLEDAMELAAALAKAEDLEAEAEALRELNVRLAAAAEEVAAMVVSDDTASSSSEGHLTVLRQEAETARNALVVAEERAKVDRDALLSKIRMLESDLAESEGALGDVNNTTSLTEARTKIEQLTALAEKRGDTLLLAEAQAQKAAAEVASLRTQLEQTKKTSEDSMSLAKIRELESLVAEMLTQSEADEQSDDLKSKIRSLESQMAELIDPEEMDTLLAHVRQVEARVAEMIDVEELVAAEQRAREMEVERNVLRAKVRALEVEMASMMYSDEVGDQFAKVRALETEMATMSYDDEASDADPARGATAAAVNASVAAPAPTTVSNEPDANAKSAQAWIDAWKADLGASTITKKAFKRDPNATFTKRALTFTNGSDVKHKKFQRGGTFTLRRMTFAPSSRGVSKEATDVKRPSQKTQGSAVTYMFDDATKSDSNMKSDSKTDSSMSQTKNFKRGSPDSFILRKFDFPAVRAKTVTAKAFKRTPGTFSKRRLVFTDSKNKTIELDNVPAAASSAFERTGTFTLRRFDFIKANAAKDELWCINSSGAGTSDVKREFKRTLGAFTLRRFKFWQ